MKETLEFEPEDFKTLLRMLGYATGHAAAAGDEDAARFLEVSKIVLKQKNPHAAPLELPEAYS